MAPNKQPINKQSGKKGTGKAPKIIMGVLIVLGLLAAVAAFVLAKNLVQTWNITQGIPGQPVFDQQGNVISTAEPGTTAKAPTMVAPIDVEHAQWDGKERVNILLMGLDYRDWEANEIPRTDTMILVSVDPASKTLSMLSILRDLWVDVPGFGHHKINTAYFLGEGNRLPGGGPQLATDTVEQFLGVPIQYYAQIDFMAFVKFIDEIGGVDIHVKQEVTIDPFGPGNTIHLYEGVQTFDGATTLAYARARKTSEGDVDRARRQQEVVMAIRDNVVNYYGMTKLMSKAPALYNSLASGIRTNMDFADAVKLAWLVSEIKEEDYHKAVISVDMAVSAEVKNPSPPPDMLSVLKPLPDRIRLLRDELFTVGTAFGPQALQNDPVALLQTEAARVSVQNGTGNPGLATRTREYVAAQGVSVVEETNAPGAYAQSEIQIYNAKPYTAKYFANLLGIDVNRVTMTYNPDSPVDIVVILGSDWDANNPMP